MSRSLHLQVTSGSNTNMRYPVSFVTLMSYFSWLFIRLGYLKYLNIEPRGSRNHTEKLILPENTFKIVASKYGSYD